jgi:hypothetical protein
LYPVLCLYVCKIVIFFTELNVKNISVQQSQLCGTVKYVAPNVSTLVSATDLYGSFNAKQDLYLEVKVKGKVVLVLNSLSTIPLRCVEEWRYSSTSLELCARQR